MRKRERERKFYWWGKDLRLSDVDVDELKKGGGPGLAVVPREAVRIRRKLVRMGWDVVSPRKEAAGQPVPDVETEHDPPLRISRL